MSQLSRQTRGFTLLEMSIVLLIIGGIMAGGAVMFAASLQKRQAEDTMARLAIIQKALLDFRRANNRIPCPAVVTFIITSPSFGGESITAGNCSSPLNGGSIYEGMVPTKTLQLPDDMAFDGWGRRIMYAVDSNLAVDNAFASVPVDDATARITIQGISSTVKTNRAAYALISFGQDGHGGYPRNMSSSVRINAGITEPDALKNCDCNNSAVYSGAVAGVFVQKPSTTDPLYQNVFDDIVVYATRGDLRALTE